MTGVLSASDQRVLLECAREAIRSRLGRQEPVYPPAPSSLDEECGAFVTLRLDGELRGCIGHVSACQALLDAVKSAAIAAAFNDPRFPPLTPAEYAGVQIEISVLSPFQRISDPCQVVPGTHGVMIRSGYRSGLLLPQVATEQGWNRETFLSHACRKAGLPPDAWKSPPTTIDIFTATVFHEPQE
ncbi:MAG TPA: AmmeMemoRadiSam system protein A [Spirochaetia bacterium]|nr:AmmeMemoRadiSam system protein A [Spirochaetia bacterium]